MFIERLNELLEENNLNRKQFAEKSGIPYTTVIGWTTLNRLPDYTALIKIADYFQCSLDYLTEREEWYGYGITKENITDKEKSLVKKYRRLDPENKELVEKLISALFEQK